MSNDIDIKENTLKKDLDPKEMLRVIFEYAGCIANERQLDKILMLMADMGRELVVSDRCTLWLLDEDSQELWTKVAHGIEEIRIPKDTGVVGKVINMGTPLITDNAYNEDSFNPEVDKKTGYLTRALLVIPLKNGDGNVIGAYQAVNKMTKERVFTEADLEHLTLAATYAESSLESAMLNREIEKTQKEIIYLMAGIGESRSKETGNHVKRVAEYSHLLALLYGLPKEEAELIRMSSPMHDIGKVAIPDKILLKPGKLTAEEFDVIKTHSAIGFNLLKGSKRRILKASSIIAYEHHEKWNGKGYPQQLKEDEIHIYGRISAIADVFDALGSDRYYKKAWDIDRILNLFKEERGIHFDPNLTDLFLENIKDFLDIRNKYADLIND